MRGGQLTMQREIQGRKEFDSRTILEVQHGTQVGIPGKKGKKDRI